MAEDKQAALVRWLAARFMEESGIDVSNDSSAMNRLDGAARTALSELNHWGETTVNLPFLSSDAGGPKHLRVAIKDSDLDGILAESMASAGPDRNAAFPGRPGRDAGASPVQDGASNADAPSVMQFGFEAVDDDDPFAHEITPADEVTPSWEKDAKQAKGHAMPSADEVRHRTGQTKRGTARKRRSRKDPASSDPWGRSPDDWNAKESDRKLDTLSLVLVYSGVVSGLGALGMAIYWSWPVWVGHGSRSLSVRLVVVFAALALDGMTMTFIAARRWTHTGYDYLGFDTWFPMAMSAVPFVGFFMALYYAIRLLVGRLAAASITTSYGPGSSSRNTYPATNIGITGIPGGLVLLAFALIHAVVVYRARSHLIPGYHHAPATKSTSVRGVPRGAAAKASRRTCPKSGEVVVKNETIRVDRRNRYFPLLQGCRLRLKMCRLVGSKPLALRGTGRLVMEGGRLAMNPDGLLVEDHVWVTLRGVNVKAKDTAIHASGQAVVVLDGGRVAGATAVSATDQAVILYHDVNLRGRWKRSGTAMILAFHQGQDLDKVLAKARHFGVALKRYREDACNGIMACYEKADYFGAVASRVTLHFGSDGAVDRSKMELKHADKLVRSCVQKLVGAKKLSHFVGPVGTARCTFVGRLSSGTRVMNSHKEYRPDSWPGDLFGGRNMRRNKRRRRHGSSHGHRRHR